jgi:hypothetical protein
MGNLKTRIADFESIEKVINETVMEKWVFDFYYCPQKFSAYNFFGELFAILFNEFEINIKFSIFWFPNWSIAKNYFLDPSSTFCKLWIQTHSKWLKNEKWFLNLCPKRQVCIYVLFSMLKFVKTVEITAVSYIVSHTPKPTIPPPTSFHQRTHKPRHWHFRIFLWPFFCLVLNVLVRSAPSLVKKKRKKITKKIEE